MIRSVEFTLRDDTDSTHDHAYTVGAGAMEPSIDATYVPPAQRRSAPAHSTSPTTTRWAGCSLARTRSRSRRARRRS
jgi:hypothetical protein